MSESTHGQTQALGCVREAEGSHSVLTPTECGGRVSTSVLWGPAGSRAQVTTDQRQVPSESASPPPQGERRHKEWT